MIRRELFVSFGLCASLVAFGACSLSLPFVPAQEEVVITEAPQEEAAPALPSLFFEWELGEGTLISAPLDVQDNAAEACRTRGYDSAHMVNLAISGRTAQAEYGCRGAD